MKNSKEAEINLKVSIHGYKRGKERIGLPKRAILKQFKLAIEKGVHQGETTGKLRKYLDALSLHEEQAHKVSAWNNHLFVYTIQKVEQVDTAVLITVLPLPPYIARLIHYKKKGERQ